MFVEKEIENNEELRSSSMFNKKGLLELANTYHQIYIHVIFSVRNREYVIPKNKKEELHKYITGIVKQNQCKLIAINSMPDHIHIFFGLSPSKCISDIVKDIKIASTDKIKEWIKTNFHWQDGFGAFSYSRSQIDKVVKYIMNQEEHHKNHSFKEEYIDFMKNFGIKYDDKYLFDIK